MSSKELKGLLKVTHYKFCECLRFSTLSSLVSITHLSICLSASYDFKFIVHFSSQYAYSKKITPLWSRLLGFAHMLFNHATKNFLILRSNYTTKVCLVLFELFVSKTGPKFNCFIHVFTTSLLIMRAYTHAHCYLLSKAGRETRPCD